MNILMLSNSASFHQLAQILEKNTDIDCIYHYGAHPKTSATEKYFPRFIDIPVYGATKEIKQVLEETKFTKFDLVIASGLSVPGSKFFKEYLNAQNIPRLFPPNELTTLENDRMLTKGMLKKLGIPCSVGIKMSAWELFRDFFKLEKPFVVKIETRYFHGRQTLIITDENYEYIFSQLFSKFVKSAPNPLSIDLNDRVVIENYLEIDHEISYHAIMHETSWKFLGAARDYKKQYDNDQGDLSDGMGSYFLTEVDQQLHQYTDKIFNYLKSIGRPYKGILFLGIAILKDGSPTILEINTRAGDPEIGAIAASTINFSDMILSAGLNETIPDAQWSKKQSVSVVITNSDTNWNVPANQIPNFDDVPKDILFGITGCSTFKNRHSVFTASEDNRIKSAEKIFNYLKTKDLGQFYYRKDIGLLK